MATCGAGATLRGTGSHGYRHGQCTPWAGSLSRNIGPPPAMADKKSGEANWAWPLRGWPAPDLPPPRSRRPPASRGTPRRKWCPSPTTSHPGRDPYMDGYCSVPTATYAKCHSSPYGATTRVGLNLPQIVPPGTNSPHVPFSDFVARVLAAQAAAARALRGRAVPGPYLGHPPLIVAIRAAPQARHGFFGGEQLT